MLIRWLTRGALAVVAFALALYVGAAAFVAYTFSIPKRNAFAGNPQSVAGLGYEDVGFAARDTSGTRIAAWYVPAPNATQVVILVHGKDSCRGCEFSRQAVNLARDLKARGLAVLMIDLRGHGQSGDGRFTFGLRERYDVLGAVDWLRGRGFGAGRIGVLGVSLGAATALGAAAEEPAIGAVVADSGYADFVVILREQFTHETGFPAIVVPPALWIARALTGSDLNDSKPAFDIVRILPRPVLVIHALGDQLIPIRDANALALAAGTTPWIMAGREHANTYSFDPQAYAARVGSFFLSNLNP